MVSQNAQADQPVQTPLPPAGRRHRNGGPQASLSVTRAPAPTSVGQVALAFTTEDVDRAIDFVIQSRAIDRAQTVRYTAVFEAAGLPPPQELHLGGDSDAVTVFMRSFHDRCLARELPPLDSLVVHVAGSREGRPGPGYFRVNGQVDPFAEHSIASAEQLIAAHAFWEAQRDVVKAWGIQRRRGRR